MATFDVPDDLVQTMRERFGEDWESRPDYAQIVKSMWLQSLLFSYNETFRTLPDEAPADAVEFDVPYTVDVGARVMYSPSRGEGWVVAVNIWGESLRENLDASVVKISARGRPGEEPANHPEVVTEAGGTQVATGQLEATLREHARQQWWPGWRHN